MDGVIRVVIVDDHPVVREGLRAFLQLAPDIEVVGEADSGAAAVSLLGDYTLDVTVVIMDLKMPGAFDGIEAIARIKRVRPELKFLALTSFQDDASALSALSAGAIGYLHKDVPPDLLLGGIRQAASGRMVLEQNVWEAARTNGYRETPELTRGDTSGRTSADESDLQPGSMDGGGGHVADEKVPVAAEAVLAEPLTDREHEVLQAIAKGLSNKEIGALLGITEKTVKAHISHILGKLGVFDRTQAVLLAIKLKLVTVP